MNDHRNHRYRESEPAWPTGDDSTRRAPASPQEEAPERTGFWSPLWEDDDEPPARPGRNGHSRDNSHALDAHAPQNGRSRGSHARNDEPNWPGAEPPAEPRWPGAEPPARPRPASRSAAPAWPTAEPAGGHQPRRPGGPHTPPPGAGHPNGAPGPAGARPPAGPPTRVVRPRPAGPPRPGAPGADPEGPTELLPPVHHGTGPEPQLLTHREPDYDEDRNDDPDFDDGYYDEDGDGPLSEHDRRKRRKKVWRRVRRTMYVFVALMIIMPVAGFFVAYQLVEVPKTEVVAARQGQVVKVKYQGGELLSQIVPPEGTRQMVTYSEIPDVVKHAVYAAEDAEFETNPGFDISGVLRAGWNQVSGGDGGGSTITQQYIKKATGDDEPTITRKGIEIVKAYKMNNTYSKPEIITAYLNTIYFGRSANGIAAAAQAYYKTPLDKINASQAALLAGMIQTPGRDEDMPYMKRRWKFVMDQMLQKGWITAEERKAAAFPALADKDAARPKAIQGPGKHIQDAVLDEVEREAGFTREELEREGLTIVSTIDYNAQKLTIDALNEVMAGEPANLLPAMVSVDPKTGAVLSYYGGANGNGLDWAAQRQEPGSSFKPFDLVALLEEGKGLGERYDGTSGRIIGGQKVRNASGASCGKQCTVAEAMERSINTVFYDIAVNEVGTQKVADAAQAAGIRSPLKGADGGAPDANISIGGGTTAVTTYEMASAYATFAANGIYRKPHMVSQILDAKNRVVWQPEPDAYKGKPAFDEADAEHNRQIARNVTESLKPVLPHSKLTCDDGRECAGKTGTHQFRETEDNAKAWMVGYSPQISVAVSMAAEENNKQVPLKNAKGRIIYGAGLPGEIWQTFMNNYLKDMPKEGFGRYEAIGKPVPKEGDRDDDRKPSDKKPSDKKPSDTKPTGTKPSDTTEQTKPTRPTETTETSDTDGGIIPPIGGGGGGGGGGGSGGDG